MVLQDGPVRPMVRKRVGHRGVAGLDGRPMPMVPDTVDLKIQPPSVRPTI